MDAGIDMAAIPHDCEFYIPEGPAPACALQLPLGIDSEGLDVSASLIIPTFMNNALKAGCLSTVLDGITESKCIQELVLIAADDTPTRYHHLAHKIGGKRFRVVHGPPNQRAKARNIGAAHATQPFLVFLDDDMVPCSWLAVDAILAEVVSGEWDCALFPRRHYLRFPALYEPKRMAQLALRWRAQSRASRIGGILDPLAAQVRFKTTRFCFPGCFMAITRSAFDKVGGFDEGYGGWGCEDSHFALRAVEVLRVMNLFARDVPFLHVDHPVSPYKSEEHRSNYERFAKVYGAARLDALCDRVFTGQHWPPETAAALTDPSEPILEAVRSLRLPVDPAEVRHSVDHIAESRLSVGLGSSPRFIAVFGSFARNEQTPQSDADLLVVYPDGRTRGHFVTAQVPPVEVEYADQGKFEGLADQPESAPVTSALELAKLREGRLVWGPPADWEAWRSSLVESGARNGIVCWTLAAVGLALRRGKHGSLAALFARSYLALCAPVCPATTSVVSRTGSLLSGAALGAAGLLDEHRPQWRSSTAASKPITTYQTPEMWTAIRWISNSQSRDAGGARVTS